MPRPSILLAFLISLLLHGAVLWRPPRHVTPLPTPAPLTAILLSPSAEPDAVLKNTLSLGITTAQRKLSPYLYYPEEAIRRGWEGEVRLLLRFDATGMILHVEIAAGSGHALLDHAAVQAVQSLRQLPNIGVREMILPVKFQLL